MHSSAVLCSTIDFGCANADAINVRMTIYIRLVAHRSSSGSLNESPSSICFFSSRFDIIHTQCDRHHYFILLSSLFYNDFHLVARSLVHSFIQSLFVCLLFTLWQNRFSSIWPACSCIFVFFSVLTTFIRAYCWARLNFETIQKQLVVCRYCIRNGIMCMAVIFEWNRKYKQFIAFKCLC